MKPESTRIIFMGTPAFAVASLKALNDAGLDVAGIVTSPDKPAGRGKKLKNSAVKEFALSSLTCPILQPEKLKDPDFIEKLIDLDAHMYIVVAFRMLPKQVWSIPPKGTINLHASLLPQYRGAAPINWSIINGEKKTGITTFLIDEKIDTGMILLQEQVPIDDDDTAGTLHDTLMMIGSELLVKTVFKRIADITEAVAQTDFNSSEKLKKAPKIFKEDCRIDWSKNSSDVNNLIRGLSPYPGAYSLLKINESDEIQLKIICTRILKTGTGLVPGKIVSDNKSTFHVETSDGILEITELQAPGKKRMAAADFVRGFQLDLSSLRLV